MSDDGKFRGNLRSMHNSETAKLIRARLDEAEPTLADVVASYMSSGVAPQAALDDWRVKGGTIPDDAWYVEWGAERRRRLTAKPAGAVHRQPFKGRTVVSCCGRTVDELGPKDSLTWKPSYVTCNGNR